MKTWMGTLVLVLGMTMATSAGAQPFGPPEWGRGKGMGFGRMHGPGPGICGILRASDAGLSEEQRGAITPVCQAHRERTRALFEQIGELREQVRATVDADVVDMGRVEALHAQMAELMTALVKKRVETRDVVQGQLSDEQMAKAADLRARMRKYRREGEERGGKGKGFGEGRGLGPEGEDW